MSPPRNGIPHSSPDKTMAYRSNAVFSGRAAPHQLKFGQIVAIALKVIRVNIRQATLGRQTP
jgi:hypothetical protein